MVVALVAAATGCAGVTPPSLREEQPATPALPQSSSAATPTVSNASGNAPATEPTLTAGTLASSATSAGVAVGAELQRTDGWVLGGRIWAMTSDGTADNVTDHPKVQLVAVNVNGSTTVIAEVASADAKDVATIQGGVNVPIPARTVSLQIQTTLRSPKGGGGAPVLVVSLSDVPVVKQLPAQP
jgi:hypothetical protein